VARPPRPPITAPQRLQRGHHPAMPFGDVPAFVVELQRRAAVSALALEF
jgi:hypothetical protein